MQVGQIKERILHIEDWIDDAAQACKQSTIVPRELCDCLGELDRASEHTRQMVEQEADREKIRQCVDRLEEVGDRAMQACRQARGVDHQLQVALRQTHLAISTLKQQLH